MLNVMQSNEYVPSARHGVFPALTAGTPLYIPALTSAL